MRYGFRRYVPVRTRRRNAEREIERLRRKGHEHSPVILEGRRIARTFWGKSWCSNLERYSDYTNRLPRGRTYLRNGSVIDLQVTAGSVIARVMGSSLYRVQITVAAVPKQRWAHICRDCAGGIDSLVELLQGSLSKSVMERICRQRTGLFPSPEEIEFDCSCPDWASMCKHIAAALYGVGARLDQQPDLLFVLRRVDHNDLIAKARNGLPLGNKRPAAARILSEENLSQLFGIEIAQAAPRRKGKAASAPSSRRGGGRA
jgi:uncharacterized Zn finger protein